MEANFDLEKDVLAALKSGLGAEESPVGKEIFYQLLENAEIARTERMPICQDTGLAVVFVDIGQDAHVTGGSLDEAINEGVRRGYTEGYLRKSVLGDPAQAREHEGQHAGRDPHADRAGEQAHALGRPEGRREREHEQDRDAQARRRRRGREEVRRRVGAGRLGQSVPADHRRASGSAARSSSAR